MTPVPPAMPAAVFATRLPYRLGVTCEYKPEHINFHIKKPSEPGHVAYNNVGNSWILTYQRIKF